ncbi:pyridoxal phosphate-dependent decarboxylase family protein [Cochlodiniinecator piscidefendens]|uniref:pyridoxal phosphate-dependent decarboxylase family protein n=1 Tax=Cochlodiniinecator piscidefendens TaxID=2715756 RepID=UPI0014087DB7|nr:pyridoxal-dependent decarboxylase [Cochlodiniinecator piscidefendens]
MSSDNKTSPLDPQDWDAFRSEAHAFLDACMDQMQNARDYPWQPVPEEVKERFAIGTQNASVTERLKSDVLPYGCGSPHPQFWGWVQGTGLASGFLSEMANVVTNINCGGRDHGAVYMERAVIDWTRQQMGFPETASGVLVTGTSQATVIAFAAARLRALGANVRKTGQGDVRLVAYASGGVHNASKKAIELLGIGSDNLRLVPTVDGQMDVSALAGMVAEDHASGAKPFLVVGNAGTVDIGAFDDLNLLADAAENLDLWLHVDGAFGAWTRIAEAPYRCLTDGIERADSIALDYHKWMYVNYDCGCVLIRDEDEHRAAFAARPAYLQGGARGLSGGDPWFCDYGIDLSRGNRALKVWTALETYGIDAFSQAITGNCHLAAYMASQVGSAQNMRVVAPVASNVCVFTADETLAADAQSDLNQRISEDLQENGEAVFSTTLVDGVKVLRAAITNHRTHQTDIDAALAAVMKARG